MTAAPRHGHKPDELRTATIARYMTVRHLSDADAATVLGIGPGSVRCYRRQYPETRPDGWCLVGNAERAAQRVQAVQTANAIAKARRPSSAYPKRSYEVPVSKRLLANGAMTAANVSLPVEPWGQV